MKQFFKWFVPSTAIVLGAVFTTGAHARYTEDMGMGLGLIHYYNDNCSKMSRSGYKVARVLNRQMKITTNHSADYELGQEMGGILGCNGLRDAWTDDSEINKWASMFFGKGWEYK